MHLTQMLHSAADTRPNHCATIDGDRRKSWAEVRERVSRLAGALRKLDMKAGDRVAILALNSDRYTEYMFATWWAGGAVVPMNTRWSATENAYSLNDSQAEILLVDSHFAPMIQEIGDEAKTVRTIVHLEENAPEGMLSFEDLIAAHDPCEDAMRSEDDLAGLFYTGGTTGFPKGVMVSQKALWYNNIALGGQANFKSDSIYLHTAPMFHMADLAAGGGAMMAGGTHVYVPSFEPVSTMNAIAENKVTHALLVPTMLGMVLQHPEFDVAKFASVTNYLYGASPMPEGLLRQAMSLLPHVDFSQAYGQTEMAPLVTILDPKDHVLEGPRSKQIKSAGRPAWGCEIKIVDEDGKEVPRGTVGEIAARSPGNMLGYWQQPEQTADTLIDGWVHTGDGAYQDEEGFVYIVDRMKDMIVSGGENVFSAEVESAISTHPDVAGVAVVGIPSEQWGESVHAIVIPKEGSTPDEQSIIAHCKDQIAGYKCPRSIDFRTEPFPLSGAGKVLKRELRAPYWKGQERSVS
ncbi:Acyl-CoA synthetase (AMP-forming)/AMP-acid ligase II [Parasphingorhabdus marina DSM 22363]|uniref:3-methylmercaptopropionyl-CoA ligase n=1 Tax=Parasphingorhabdus marina DSM 22363 TaxID=1123272 RepID=A0A1N6GRN7_9SPHN|nr:long-chain-fatty-acid--CoA ligase [Parasphingorhabdus marina]SIO10226.1 Acyl-CoA synthetase (AMP-forming)/AMP-acid ligase II [Parasphingorhabdus marina DSM 22363]